MALEIGDLTEFKSSALKAAGWDEEDGTFSILFSSGKVYDYEDVPEKIWNDFRAADSQGRYYAKNIKGVYLGAERRRS